jgi:hypothetical protein
VNSKPTSTPLTNYTSFSAPFEARRLRRADIYLADGSSFKYDALSVPFFLAISINVG